MLTATEAGQHALSAFMAPSELPVPPAVCLEALMGLTGILPNPRNMPICVWARVLAFVFGC